MPRHQHPCPVQPLTHGPLHHFFGYYDKSPWSADGRKLLAKRVARIWKRPPTAEDLAIIGMLDTDSGRFIPLAQTTAWNWQQGCMLQWLGLAPDRLIIFNRRSAAGGLEAAILDIGNGAVRSLAAPVYGVAPNGRDAVTGNFARLHKTRPGYGYSDIADFWESDAVPAGDGVRHVAVETGDVQLIFPLSQIAALAADPRMDGATHWINHLQFNPSGSRFAMLHRWKSDAASKHTTRLLTGNTAGGDLRLLEASGFVSHYDWRDDEHVLAWSEHAGERHYHLYRDATEGEVTILGAELFDEDGHCSYGPDRRFLLTDTYPDQERSERTLIIYDCDTNTRYDVGHFFSDPAVGGEIRCDLHPRWSRDGRSVCMDSIHEGERQMYRIDVSGITG